jgi:hypothetical protein
MGNVQKTITLLDHDELLDLLTSMFTRPPCWSPFRNEYILTLTIISLIILQHVDPLLSNDYKQRPLLDNDSGISKIHGSRCWITAWQTNIFPRKRLNYNNEERRFLRGPCRVEAGSNTSTVALRVVGGDDKRSLESETVKCGHGSRGTRTWEWLRWRGPAAIVNDRPVLSWERMLHKDNDRKGSVAKKSLVVTVKGLGAKTNWLAINRQS